MIKIFRQKILVIPYKPAYSIDLIVNKRKVPKVIVLILLAFVIKKPRQEILE